MRAGTSPRPPELRHGRPSDYVRGCRCPECQAARRVAERERRWRAAGVVPTAPCPECGDVMSPAGLNSHRSARHGWRPPHGGESRYAAGCRCAECREAARVARTRYRGVVRARFPGALACPACGVWVRNAQGLANHAKAVHKGEAK